MRAVVSHFVSHGQRDDTRLPAERGSDALAKRALQEYGRRMEIALLIVAVIVAIVLVANSPWARSHGRAADADPHAVAVRAHENRQFTKPPDEGGLL